jgi:hypothetical protein
MLLRATAHAERTSLPYEMCSLGYPRHYMKGTMQLHESGFLLDLRDAAWYKLPVSDAGGCRLCPDPADSTIIPADLPPRFIQ